MKYVLYDNVFHQMESFRAASLTWGSPPNQKSFTGYPYRFASEVPYPDANGNPFRMRFKANDNTNYNLIFKAPGSINCCTSVLSAFYKEWERLACVDFLSCTMDKKLPQEVSQYFAIAWPPPFSSFPPHYEKGGAYPLSKEPLNVLV